MDAQTRGLLLHSALEQWHLMRDRPASETPLQRACALQGLALPPADHDEIQNEIERTLAHPSWHEMTDGASLFFEALLPVTEPNYKIHAKIDLLVLRGKDAWIYDFKSTASRRRAA